MKRLLSLDDGLNSYERSLVSKASARDSFFDEWVEEPPEEAKYIIVYPMNSGLGNNLAILAEGVLMSMLLHRQLMSASLDLS